MTIIALLLAAQASAFDQVVASERAFAAASLAKGHHESFLAHLAPDAIAFNPVPVPARPLHEGKPPSSIKLNWAPAWVAVSTAGDLALSSGPWEIKHKEKSVIDVSTGIYFSVWRLQPDGSWKVAVDAGISSPVTFVAPKTVENGYAGAQPKSPIPDAAETAQSGIRVAEQSVTAATKLGIGAAIQAVADARIRVFREGKAPGTNPVAARALLAEDKRQSTCTPEGIVASGSGDLGYSYGTCTREEGAKSEKHGFLHVWRKAPDGRWKILADVTP